MALSKVWAGWMAACALSAACADTLPGAGIASGSLARAERFGYRDAGLPPVAADLNEQVMRIPADPSGSVTLEATLFKPDGPGPFPLVVFNHGKNTGDLHRQPRSRPLAFAREFVRRGYAVIAPNRQGFAGSSGTYRQAGCDVAQNGLEQAADVDATIRYMTRQPYVDASKIVVAGTSHGGLASLAYGTEAAHGVRGIVNFSGGLRQDLCEGWQRNLVDAFDQYGAHAALPSLWLYGDNDSVWTPELVARMHDAYASHGARVSFVDYGRYKDDAHRLIVDRDGVPIWWPAVDAFLAELHLPTAVRYAVAQPREPKASGYASIDAVDAVPFIDGSGRDGYRHFLHQHPSRAFAVSERGAWSWAEGGDDPMTLALDNCAKQGAGPCRLYAVNDRVVWNTAAEQTAARDDAPRPVGAPVTHSLAAR